MKLFLIIAAAVAFAADEPPPIPLEHQLDLANAESALLEAQIRFKDANQVLLADCKGWALARDMKTRRFSCVAKPEPPPK